MSLVIYQGPMFASKSKNLFSRLSHLIDVFPTKRSLVITSKHDTRGEESHGDINDIEIYDKLNDNSIITSHSSLFKGIPKKVNCLMRVLNLHDVDVTEYDIIAIEEGQFFNDLHDTVKYWVDGLGKWVLIASLDTNWKREPFGQIHLCSSFANEIHKCSANCLRCIKELGDLVNPESLPLATFTARKIDSCDEILVGDDDKYEATCRRHHPYSSKIKESVISVQPSGRPISFYMNL